MDSIAQSSEGVETFFADLDETSWVFEWPVEPFRFPGENWTLFARLVTNSNYEIELLPLKLRYRLGPLRGDVDADLTHDRHSFRTDSSRMGARREDLVKVTSLVPKQGLGHLTPGRVAGANDQHSFLLHKRLFHDERLFAAPDVRGCERYGAPAG